MKLAVAAKLLTATFTIWQMTLERRSSCQEKERQWHCGTFQRSMVLFFTVDV